MFSTFSRRRRPNTVRLFLACLAVVALWHVSIATAGGDVAAHKRLKSCDPKVSLAAADEILNDPKTLTEPALMFSPAYFLLVHGRKDESVFWFYAAQLRFRYQAAIKQGDYGQVLSVMLMTVGPSINNYAFQDTAKLSNIIDRVLEWDRTTPNPLRQLVKSEEVATRVGKVYSGMNDLKVKLVAEKDALENSARLAAPQVQLMNQATARECKREVQPFNPPDAAR